MRYGKGFKRTFWLMVVLVASGFAASAQTGDKAALEAEREAIAARIAATQKLLHESQDDQKKTTRQLAILEEELALRQQLLSNLQSERRETERRLAARQSSVSKADAQVQALKDEYAEMIRVAARLQGQNALWGLLLDAETTTQVFQRLLLIEEYGRLRKSQAELISTSTLALREEMDGLRREKAALVSLEVESREQRDAARKGALRQENILSDLRSKERQLKDQLAKEEARRAELGKAIDRILAAARRNSNEGEGFAATPEGKIIGAEFKANRGKLPWPVAEGVIVGRFGTHNHPSIPGIQIERRGIDIATSSDAAVTAVFSGRVSNVITIPGGGMVVMVDHGSHRTVYANLSRVDVQDGEDVITGQPVGTVLDQGNGHRAHFEIWDAAGSAPLNPELWIAR